MFIAGRKLARLNAWLHTPDPYDGMRPIDGFCWFGFNMVGFLLFFLLWSLR